MAKKSTSGAPQNEKKSERKAANSKGGSGTRRNVVLTLGIAMAIGGVAVLVQMLRDGVRDPLAELADIEKEMAKYDDVKNKTDDLVAQLQGRVKNLESDEKGYASKLAASTKLQDELNQRLAGQTAKEQILAAKAKNFGQQEQTLKHGLSALEKEENELRAKLESLAKQEKLLEERLAVQGAK